MAELQQGAIIDRLRANLRAAGIGLAETELQAMQEKGFLKPVLAFEELSAEVAQDSMPEYLSAWGYPSAEEFRRDELPSFPVGLPPHSPRNQPKTGDPLVSTVRELSLLIASGELSPVDLVEGVIERIAERDESLNVFQLRRDEAAIAEAYSAESELRNGRWRGVLHGIPIAVKDNMDIGGLPTSAGSIILGKDAEGRVLCANSDSAAVARLKAAGAIIVGKTRMSEFAYSPGSNNDHFGSTRNPQGLERDSGGSSSGSAAAVSAALVPAALGTDTGGSIRIPASFCGIVGFKPTFGRLSLHGTVSLSWSLDHLGPLTRSVQDAAILADVLGGYDPRDPRMRNHSERSLATDLAERSARGLPGLRVGVLRNDGSGRELASAEVVAAWKRGLGAMEAAGAALVEVDLPELQDLRSLNATILAIEAAAFHLPMLRSRLADYGEFTRLRLLAGFAYAPIDFVKAQRHRLLLRDRCGEIFDRIDLLTTPTMPSEAIALGTPARITFTAPFNLLGWPAISIPCGRSTEGLPLGMQIVGKPWDEKTVLLAAAVSEEGLKYR